MRSTVIDRSKHLVLAVEKWSRTTANAPYDFPLDEPYEWE